MRGISGRARAVFRIDTFRIDTWFGGRKRLLRWIKEGEAGEMGEHKQEAELRSRARLHQSQSQEGSALP